MTTHDLSAEHRAELRREAQWPLPITLHTKDLRIAALAAGLLEALDALKAAEGERDEANDAYAAAVRSWDRTCQERDAAMERVAAVRKRAVMSPAAGRWHCYLCGADWWDGDESMAGCLLCARAWGIGEPEAHGERCPLSPTE